MARGDGNGNGWKQGLTLSAASAGWRPSILIEYHETTKVRDLFLLRGLAHSQIRLKRTRSEPIVANF